MEGRNMRRSIQSWLIFPCFVYFTILFSGSVFSQQPSVDYREPYSPYLDQSYPTKVYWGDTHVHTNLSVDANALGKNKLLGPDQAYRFAKGEIVRAHNGMQAKLRRPLDFLAVADHAFNLGLMFAIEEGDQRVLQTDSGKKLYQQWRDLQSNPDKQSRSINIKKFALHNLFPFFDNKKPILNDDSFLASTWQKVTASADKHNEPGIFTAFIGYEWTSFGADTVRRENWSNLHRVVLYKDGAHKANQLLPLTAFDTTDPEMLWQHMEAYEQMTGGEVLAIPHNGNMSQGQMFSPYTVDGQAITLAYAKNRSRWEPLYEVTQIKGDSETHPVLSPADDFSDYETMYSFAGKKQEMARVTMPKWIENKKSEYARSALKLGLAQKSLIGVNPFKFGLIGSTDTHNSLAAVDNDNFWGQRTTSEPNAMRMSVIGGLAAGGYAGVWAQENTRESLFAAMRRKEVYASTGPRIRVRFFGGWDYESDDAMKPNLVKIGYSKGVPMGGDLSVSPKSKAPRFLIRAVRDPDGANLDRVQVIKGWRDNKGELHEKIYNVALANRPGRDKKGRVLSVGSTVDVDDATYTNKIGAPELATVWMDPDFSKDELAFYYVRVLEIPTPRWTAYDRARFSIVEGISGIPMVTQERAYTSPIWYTP